MNQEVWEIEVFGGHNAYQDAFWHGWGETERPGVKNTEVVMCSLKQGKTKRAIYHNLVVRKTGSRARLSRFATQLSHLLASCMTSSRSLKPLSTLVSSSATWR